jgi:hypothetical protein
MPELEEMVEARAEEKYRARIAGETEAVAAEFEVDAPASEPIEPEHD